MKQSNVYSIRFADEDFEKVKRNASKAELSVSDYIRKSALKAKITPRFTDEDAIRTGSRGLAPCAQPFKGYSAL